MLVSTFNLLLLFPEICMSLNICVSQLWHPLKIAQIGITRQQPEKKKTNTVKSNRWIKNLQVILCSRLCATDQIIPCSPYLHIY